MQVIAGSISIAAHLLQHSVAKPYQTSMTSMASCRVDQWESTPLQIASTPYRSSMLGNVSSKHVIIEFRGHHTEQQVHHHQATSPLRRTRAVAGLKGMTEPEDQYSTFRSSEMTQFRTNLDKNSYRPNLAATRLVVSVTRIYIRFSEHTSPGEKWFGQFIINSLR